MFLIYFGDFLYFQEIKIEERRVRVIIDTYAKELNNTFDAMKTKNELLSNYFLF